ncbi:Sacsin [Phytophthora citrophthora]|uniref:Sacsin n=1 Tax=Phytophthora citrophthora TaxID=4793 RepID=A0AAD9G370_9STRA|nr:Sacsin [Phytophthora citrophthora]
MQYYLRLNKTNESERYQEMVEADVYFGDDFGQKIDLTVRIREILRNYPEGTSIFKEMVQNADDAGASEVNLCLDYRQHVASGLAYEKLASFQGLYEDETGILVLHLLIFAMIWLCRTLVAGTQQCHRIGDSLKKDNSKGWKTGRFGVGFNSVYHVTDLPTFVSGSQLVFFDPQACHLPNVNPSNPGKMIDFIAHPDLVSNFPDQITPFRCFGCNFSEPFQGTIFRLALRTIEQAKQSKLSNRAQTPENMAEMLEEFAKSLPTVLLFLRNVCKISISEWRAGDEAPTVLHESWINNMTPDIEAKRSLQHTSLSSSGPISPQQFSTDGIICDYPLIIEARKCTTSLTETYKYLIMNQLGGGECTKIACDPANVSQRLVPWGGVAVSTSMDCKSAGSSGLAFCFLPLPSHTYLPVHVNGYFELSSNRRDIWFGEGLSGDGLLRAQWNIALLRDVIAPCYARAILHLASSQIMDPGQHVQLLPQVLPPAPWDSLALSFFLLVRDKPCLYSEFQGGRWVSPVESMVVRSSFPNSKQLEQLLIGDDFPVVRNLAEDFERVLIKTRTVPAYVEPQVIREAYKTKRSSHARNRESVECLLDFMLNDLEPDRLNALIGVKFLPVADGTLQTFERHSKVDPNELEYLCSMGFTQQHANYALAVAGGDGVEAALNWLLQNPNPSIVNGEAISTFLIPSREELHLLEKARSHLVNIEAIGAKGLTLLSSDMAAQQLNVRKLDYQGFEDMLAVVLPDAWFDKVTVPWSGADDENEPNEEWFRQLWNYLGASKHLAAFKDKWPIVPTSAQTLAQLSVSAGVLSAELIPDGCLCCLEKIHVRLLIPNLFASFQPNPEVWQFIHQPTAAGVLSCIGVVLGSRSLTAVRKLFEHTDKSDREHLLKFLISGVIEDLDANHKQICTLLPILPGFKAVNDVDGHDVPWQNRTSADSDFSSAFVSLAEILERHHEVLLCAGMGPTFLDDNFVYVKEDDAVLSDFLVGLGVRRITKVEFFAKYLIPRFNRIEPKSRVKFAYELLTELTALLDQDHDGMLSSIVETAVMFPTMMGDLRSIDELYDPEIDEFIAIMDDSFFPALELQDPQPLAALRSIGLQRALSRRSVLSLAVSLENEQMKITAGLNEEAEQDELCEKLRSRSVKFFQYVDSHMDQLVTPSSLQRQPQTHVKKSRKIKGMRFLRNFLSDDRLRGQDAHRDAGTSTAEMLEEQAMELAEIEDFKSKLAIIVWVPVCEEKLHPSAPWYKQGERVIVASPQKSRPPKHLWLCSSQFHIIKCPAHSEVLQGVLGWGKRLPAEIIATQLKDISLMFGNVRAKFDTDMKSANDRDTHVVGSAVYDIYRILSSFFESEIGERRNEVLSILSGNGKYVWVGDRFVSGNHVATMAVVNAEPYLYTIPNELLHFRPFLKAIGVRERFALQDYVHVLGAMYGECLSSKEEDVKSIPLSSDKLVTVIGLIQLISDTLQHHSDYELFAPDRNGVLELAANLTYDDAPWLNGRGYEASSGNTRFIHLKISNEVAAKIGSRSLRSQLLSESGHEAMSFGAEGDVEAFGQTEALTKRIAHILEQYPDGPNIISELIQNADDAGASRVCVLYNSCTYGTSSLLSPTMAKWQGPSLYCYNDAEFSDGDFISLARIGQASKLQRAATTGRFGLGFNSVYHFTDLPSIVSAKSIVMFDPHATHLPGISAANPGIKIRFANSSIVKQFPDQFAPFKGVFGCDLEHHYKGTLFRFPLRDNVLAESSEIKRRGYSHREIVELFRSFQGSIIDTILFLRNVRKVEVYIQSDINQPPVLLYGAEVPKEQRGDSWRKIDRFMRGNDLTGNRAGTELSAKREFYSRLRSTPTEELPSVTQVLHIRRRQQQQLETLFLQFGKTDNSPTDQEVSDVEKEDQLQESIEKYLVCNQIGGGKARDMACATENESLKLIPWVGIASRIDGVPMEGRAFCFLPLPVRVGLPVHINGYFELSSNRRDIWTGDDMSGDGKLRSEWNANLLVDAVAPAYLTFLLEAKAICQGESSEYLSFFPTKLPMGPWDSICLELFRIMSNRPMFFASTPQLIDSPRKSVAPNSCVLIDDSLSDWKTLEIALGAASLATVQIPVALRKLLIQFDAVYGAMTPAFFRKLTKQGTFLPALDQNALNCVVQFCLSDCMGSSNLSVTQALNQLPLLPLKDGKFGRICFTDSTQESDSKNHQLTFFFGDGIEERLLVEFPHRVVRGEFKEMFDSLASVYDDSNLRVLDLATILDNFLPHLLGRCWRKIDDVVFALETTSEEEGVATKNEWIKLLWMYVDTQLQKIEHLPQVFMKWPLVPILCDEGTRWVCLASNASLVLPHSGAAPLSPEVLSQLQHALAKVGVHIVDTSYVSGERSVQWLLAHKYAHKLTSGGLLASLSRYQFRHDRQSFDDIFAATTAVERQVMCDFFAHNTFDAVPNDFQPILFELPIFPVYSKSDSNNFVSLRRGGYLPGSDADIRVLNDSFFRAEKESLRRFLRECGIDEWTYTKILLDHVFPQLPRFEEQSGDLVDSVLVGALEAHAYHERADSRFRDVVTTQAIIPSRKREFRAASQLHDPSVGELSELVGENGLPAEAFSTPTMVEILRSLGLQTGLSCHAILESACSIETMYREDTATKASFKAKNLLSMVNMHFDLMMSEATTSDSMADQVESSEHQAMHEIVGKLKKVQWLPVRLESPDPAMPWRNSTERRSQGPRLSNASEMRPLNDAWFCSSSMEFLDGELTSKQLINAFGWDEPVDLFVVAKQLEAIALRWEEYGVKKESGELLSSNWRFPLSEVHSMYENLESYRLSDEEGWKASAVYRKMANALWIWTGNGFAYPCQIAVEADSTLEPLLFSCPSEHIIPRSLLASFGVKETFTTVDYLEAIMRLPRHEVLSEKQVAACLKIYEIVAEEIPALESALGSFASQEMILLDQANCLVPAVHLTFDDMEWDESLKTRQGLTFVSKKVPKAVAGALGAVSLHSKLAETSVTSRRVVCPPAGGLHSMLPPRSEWHHALLWETILAAERLGGTQVDFFLDRRHHSAQRVIQPSLQPLQDDALCIHIHDMVLSENDINNLFRGESSRTGLLCGFMVSDCMQILSGDGFYILDPTGCYLASTATVSTSSTSRTTGIGRRYEVLGQDFVRYPDQLLPFTTLPSCPSNVSRGTQSTLIRFPWRTSASAVSSHVLDSTKVDKLVELLKSQLYQTLIFTESVYRISLWSVGKESEFASHCHAEVTLESPEDTLRKRNLTRQNQDWKKKFSLQSFFKSPVIPENQMEFVVNVELENRQYRDIWLLADNIGLGRSRDLACTPVHEMLHSMPYVSVACHVFRNDNPAPRLRGYVYKIVNTQQDVGLPIHINGCFKKAVKDKELALAATSNGRENDSSGASGSEQQVAAGWNRVLLEDGVSDAYAKLLMLTKRRYEDSFPKSLYSIWPTLKQRKELGTLVQARTYQLVGTRELFLCTDGVFRALSNGYQLDLAGMNIQVASFAQLHFPAFDMPPSILQDCSRLLPSRIYSVTPKVLRRFLRSVSSAEVHPDICLSLLEYCLSDLPFPLPSETDPIWAEYHGLSLLPLEDGSIGVLRVNQRRTSYVLASFNQIELLRPLGNLFVSLAAYQRLHKYFSESRFTAVFGLVSFSIKILSDNIDRVLPPMWRNQTIVSWDPSSPIEIDELWLYRFWQVVHFERRSLQYFANWPLIPVKGSRLVSCARMDMAVCVWDESADSEIATRVVGAFQASSMEQETKMTKMEAERKQLMALSGAKFRKSDEEDSSDEEVDEEVADEDESASISSYSSDIEATVTMEDVLSSPAHTEGNSSGVLSENEGSFGDVQLSSGSVSFAFETSNDELESDEVGVGFAVPAYPVESESNEFCSRETLHNILSELNVAMMELAYLGGQESDIVPRTVDLGLVVLEGILASVWEELRWSELTEARAVHIAEFFSHNGETTGGYNRVQLEKLKQLPIFVNIQDMPCSIHGGQDFYLIPPDLSLTDIPLPPDAQQCFLKSNPRLNAFYKELGVEEMSDSKLLLYVLPRYSELLEAQRDQIMNIILQKWQALRGNAELATLLKISALFRDDEGENALYHPASAYCDPRNNVLAAIYDGVHGQFPAQRYRTTEWLDLMGEIGLQTEVTVDIFVECAQRIDDQFSGKQALAPEDEHLITTLHQFFVQNFDKFDRSRSFFERIAPLAFVPAAVYEASCELKVSERQEGQFTSRSVVRKYSECATPDDQALVYSTMPILANVALPPRVLYSRLGIQSPPPQDQVVAHLLSITHGDRAVSSRSLDWQFFLPMVEVFQAIFKFLQEKWGDLRAETQQCLTNAAVIPVGSTLVKGSRLFFHLGENLAPLMFEVPRVFGAYDALFRHMGSKEAPEVSDYIRLLRDLNEECCGHPLNLNELIAAARAIDLLVMAMAESNYRLSLEEKHSIFLPSSKAVMQSMLVMAYNNSASLCTSIDLTDLHLVHPRISTRCCKMLGVPGLTTVVTEELDRENPTELLATDDIAHYNSILASYQFADGLRKIITAQQQKASTHDAFGFAPDFEDLNQRIVSLAAYEVKCVTELHSRFIARLDFPARRVDVTKAMRQSSLSFVDHTRKQIYVASRSNKEMRTSLLVARCINQLLGGVLQDCSVLESILACDEIEIPDVLQVLDIYEDPVLIVEKLRGVLGQPLCDADCGNVELAPLRSCLPGELVAVEDESGTLCYAKVLREEPSAVSRYEVKVSSSSTRWLLATQLYFFQSARVGTSGDSSENAATTQQVTRPPKHSEDVSLPQSVVAISPEVQGNELSSVKPPAIPVSSANILSAVNDLLSRLNVTLDTNVEDLMAENLRLQRQLEVAEAGRRAAAAQIDSVLREKKEAQDSLVCAVCLENQVNRVLIPCGHIYCASCVQQLPRPSCPICRQNIVSSSVFHGRVRDLLGEPLSAEDCASVQLTPQRPCRSGEIVAVADSNGVLRYGKVREEANGEEVKVQVSKACIRWYAVSQIHFFHALGRNLLALNGGLTKDKGLQDKEAILTEVNALLATLNVSLSTSYEELLAEILQLQHRAALADEDRRAVLKQLNQALREKRDAEKALTCVVCLMNKVDCVLIPCGHSYCSPCVERLHRDLCPVCGYLNGYSCQSIIYPSVPDLLCLEQVTAMTRDKEEMALWRAAKSCNAKKLQALVSKESDSDIQSLLNQTHPEKGTTPLMVAATKKYGVETVRSLIDLGVDLDATDKGKRQNTALHFAAYNNRIPQLEVLLDAGANVFVLNGKGHTPLDVARLRGRKEAAAALTSRLQIHSGWLHIRSTSMLSFWKRRWCVLLACNSKRSATELCIFSSPDKPHPEAVLWQDSLADTTHCSTFEDVKANGFKLDTQVVYQKLFSRRYSRYKSSGRTHVHKANMQPREYIFACDTAVGRDGWMRALGTRERGNDCTNTAVSSTYAESPHRSSVRSRATTVDAAPLPSIPSPVEDSSTEKLGPWVAPQPAPALTHASAPTFVEDSDGFVWGDTPGALVLSQDTYPLATVITISGDPNEPQPGLRERCIVCAENHRDSVCIPCGHVAGCYDCMRAVTQENSSCPVCRAHVDGVIRIQD